MKKQSLVNRYLPKSLERFLMRDMKKEREFFDSITKTNKPMLTITIQEIKFIQKIKGKFPDISLREIGRQCRARFGVLRHVNTIKKALNYKL